VAAKKPAQKKAADPYVIEKKRSGRWSVINRATGKHVNGRDKLVILVERGMLKNVKVPAAPGGEASGDAPQA
jgi:hypothetical protein